MMGASSKLAIRIGGKERTNNQRKPRVACTKIKSSPSEGLTKDQYQQFLKHFTQEESKKQE